jgi:diguanylate cyclase (GGDEF)-like protein/PAS domain S-box-containing protein
MKILIVEDDVNSRVFLERALLSQGYTVESAANGIQAMEKVVLSPPDLIISDIMMPEMDGFELCRKVKTDERLQHIPFVFYTATYTDKKDEDLAMSLGASRFIVKPMEPEKFFSTIKEVIEEHRAGQLPVLDQLPVEITELDRMQIEAYARKLEKKVRELEEEREKLRKLHQDWEDFFQAIGHPTIILDAQHNILSVNKATVKATGAGCAEELIGKKCYEIFHNTSGPPEGCPLVKMLLSAKLEESEMEVEALGGIYLVSCTPVVDEKGDLQKVIHIAKDITERKQAEEKIKESEETYRNLFHNAQVGLFRTRISDGKILESNEQLAKMFGYNSREEFVAEYKTSGNYVDPGTREMMLHEIRKNGFVQNFEARFYRKDGSVFWAKYSAKIYPDKGWIEGVAEDITERKQVEEELRNEKTFIENALNSLSDAFFVFGLNGKLIRWNKIINEVLGYSDAEISSMQPADFFLKEDVHRVLDAIEVVIRDGYASVEARVLTRDGRNIPYEFTGTLLKNYEGKPLGICGIGRDITERKKAEKRIEYLAYYDALTGLPNRNLFIDRLTQGIARVEYGKKFVAVITVDIDRFKFINDTYGLKTGDAVLQEVARRLLSSVRDGDTVARLGNDDFGVLLIDIAGSADIIIVIDKIMKNVSQPIQFGGKEIILTLSAGISVYPDDGKEASLLIKNADLAFARAKQQGRKNYQFYTQDMDVKATEFVLMEKNLFNAMQNEEFLLHYQPYWDIDTKKMVGMEALIRWQSKDMGLVSPGKFISVLEDTGMIIEVGEWILRTATRQVREWQMKGYPVVPVSVNLSLIQFRQKNLAEMVKKIMGECGYYPSLLTLEITESAFMKDIEFTSTVLRKLKDIGVSVSIDDFGTGYSSLAYLKRFPIDNLKIDITFIREMVKDPDSASIVIAIINMAHTLNLKTIAEGIETEEQLNILRLLRCDMGQGFYLSKPLPAEDVENLFMQQ